MNKTASLMSVAVKAPFLPAIFLIFFYFNSSTKAIAQTEWAPIGAKWTYQIYDMWNYIFKLESFTSIKDTLLQNKTCRKIDINTLVIDSTKHTKTNYRSYQFMYGENGKIYYSYKDTFLLLYDFSLKAGDTLIVPKIYYKEFKDSLKTRYKIVTVDSINISGQKLRRQELWLIHDSVNWGADRYFCDKYNACYLIEGIGAMNYMFGEQFALDEGFSYLKCYQENFVNYKKTVTSDCNNFDVINNVFKTNEIDIYPNPAIDKINIDCAIRLDLTMQVFTTFGQCVLKRELSTQTNEIDISSLTSGIYILKLTSSNGTLEKKIIKK